MSETAKHILEWTDRVTIIPIVAVDVHVFEPVA